MMGTVKATKQVHPPLQQFSFHKHLCNETYYTWIDLKIFINKYSITKYWLLLLAVLTFIHGSLNNFILLHNFHFGFLD